MRKRDILARGGYRGEKKGREVVDLGRKGDAPFAGGEWGDDLRDGLEGGRRFALRPEKEGGDLCLLFSRWGGHSYGGGGGHLGLWGCALSPSGEKERPQRKSWPIRNHF